MLVVFKNKQKLKSNPLKPKPHLVCYSTQGLEPLQSSFESLPVYHYSAVSSDGINQVSTLIEQIAAFLSQKNIVLSHESIKEAAVCVHMEISYTWAHTHIVQKE